MDLGQTLCDVRESGLQASSAPPIMMNERGDKDVKPKRKPNWSDSQDQ